MVHCKGQARLIVVCRRQVHIAPEHNQALARHHDYVVADVLHEATADLQCTGSALVVDSHLSTFVSLAACHLSLMPLHPSWFALLHPGLRMSPACLLHVSCMSASCVPHICLISPACLPLIYHTSASYLPHVCLMSPSWLTNAPTCLPHACCMSPACLPHAFRMSSACLPHVSCMSPSWLLPPPLQCLSHAALPTSCSPAAPS